MLVLEEGDYHKVLAEGLEELAEIECIRGHHERAVCLYGTTAAWREASGTPQLPIYRRSLEQRVSEMRAALGDEAFAAAEASGRAMTMEQVLADFIPHRHQ
jgi:hypothetical protein